MKLKLIISSFVLVIFVAVYVILIETSPLPYEVIDRDSSGAVSFLEAIDAHDIGTREGAHGRGCIEYFWLKDGLPAYEQCSSDVRAQL